MTAEALGDGTKADPKLATNRNQAKQDEERGWELLLAVLLGMGLKDQFLAGMLTDPMKTQILDAIIREASASFVSTTRDLMAKKITVRVWFLRMRDILIASMAAGSLAMLGEDRLNENETDAWVSEMSLQYGYLVRFHEQIRNASQILHESAIARADLYARAIWTTSWRVLVASWLAKARANGDKVQFLRVLGVSEHCDDCLEWSAEGWVDEEDFHPIGTSVCGARCHCSVQVRTIPREPEGLRP